MAIIYIKVEEGLITDHVYLAEEHPAPEGWVPAPEVYSIGGHWDGTTFTEATMSLEDLRIERDIRLQATDWRATVDYPGVDQNSWLTYRQALRDLPEGYTPTELSNVQWPVKPSE